MVKHQANNIKRITYFKYKFCAKPKTVFVNALSVCVKPNENWGQLECNIFSVELLNVFC